MCSREPRQLHMNSLLGWPPRVRLADSALGFDSPESGSLTTVVGTGTPVSGWLTTAWLADSSYWTVQCPGGPWDLQLYTTYSIGGACGLPQLTTP